MSFGQEDTAGLIQILNPTVLQKLPTDLVRALRTSTSPEQCLEILTTVSLDPGLTDQVFAIFEPIFIDIAARWCEQKTLVDCFRAVLAFSRILPFAPYLRSFAHAALEAVTSCPNVESECFPPHDDNRCLHSVFSLFRILSFDSSFFSDTIIPAHIERLFHHPQPIIRYLAIRCFSLYIRAADAATEDMLRKYVGDNAVVGTWENITIDYRLLSLWEERRWVYFEQDLNDIRKGRENAAFEQWIRQQHTRFARSSTELGGVIVPSAKSGAVVSPSSLISTPTVLHNLRNIGRALLSNAPILLVGQSGSGKTSLINDIARKIGQSDSLVTLHLNEQTDSKSLLGVYSSTHAGSFSWQPGVLTQAAKEGRWVLIEDLDRAPPEVLGLILPLIENRELPIPSRGECIRCADGFRVIATIRSILNAYGEESIPGSNMLGIRLWNRIPVSPLPLSEVEDVITRRYSLLGSRIKMIISIYQRISSCIIENLSRKSLQGRAASLRDLMKFCQRLQRRLELLGCQTGYEPVPHSFNLKIFMDAIDCFAAYLPAGPSRDVLASEIAQELQITPQQVNFCLTEQIPQYLDTRESLTVGRESCTKRKILGRKPLKSNNSIFAPNRPSLRTMEQVAAAVNTAEPVLLVGETGIGKTAVVQQLAALLHQRVTVVNLSQQSESTDLLGGFKPVNLRSIAVPLVDEFNTLFEFTFSAKKNQKFLDTVKKSLLTSNWARLVTILKEAIKMAKSVFGKRSEVFNDHESGQPSKRPRLDAKYAGLQQKWESFGSDLNEFEGRAAQGDSGFSFAFVQGKIVKALRNGEWVLLDEINLASPDTLESIASLLNSGNDGAPSVLLSEAGEIDRVYGDTNFRIFGAMNPATDAGKKDLVPGLRSRFTEVFVNPPDSDIDDLLSLINAYLGPLTASDEKASAYLAQLYLDTKRLSLENRLTDGAGQKPHFSIRTLVRTLVYVREQASVYGLRRAMFEGFSMSFLTMLSKDSERLVIPLLEKHIFGDLPNAKSILSQTPKVPQDGRNYVRYKHYWMQQGAFIPEKQPHYIITPFIERNLMNLVRAGSIRRFPILLQGPTSSGKTSMVEYLAKVSGNHFVRVNNHEHTDLQEYLGCYVSGEDGALRYQEGVLVEALRNGYWIVLDELNLAPTDVLEALNRLLDDNRELFVPETQEVVYPHSNFMLFATQNPAGLYGGRKVLSRAFRNRFLELHFDDIPEDELEFILKERSQIAPSFCTRIVSVYKRLSILRQSNRLFEQRNSFATLRDLFRWALRKADDREQLAVNGYMLLSERVRNFQEREAVKNVIEEVMKVKLDPKSIYSEDALKSRLQHVPLKAPTGVIWTPAMRRVFILVSQAIENNEPVLLVGETGCGKTQICQAISEAYEKQLHVINAHVNLETGDIIGSQRPVRNRTSIEQQLLSDLSIAFPGSTDKGLRELSEEFSKLSEEDVNNLDVGLVSRIRDNTNKAKSLFLWSNGALTTAMESGQHFLLDEISLADDSVLERLNSVLEPARSLLLAEKGAVDSSVVAKPGFQFLATMNPGGDYGKRELSAALRNRLTEIWVPQLSETKDILPILESKLQRSNSHTPGAMLEFAKWFRERFQGASSGSMSIRDLLAWVDFVNTCTQLDLDSAIVHGAALVYVDTLGANPSAMLAASAAHLDRDRKEALEKLSLLFSLDGASIYYQSTQISFDSGTMHIGPFYLPLSSDMAQDTAFALDAPTTLSNTLRVARGLQSSKPILLEGSPGVGKTTLIVTLAQLLGKPLTRINLSEQTDLTDLFGSDVPVEGSDLGNFAWNDAAFLRALQNGGWVLLDEMNLASQSVLEGLNSCLDHRQEVYITELDQTFKRHPDFVLFAAQNPHHQGGGRKGLPTSFVNRFTVVFTDAYTTEDLKMICSRISSSAPAVEIERMVQFVSALNDSITLERRIGMIGGPWEINLRDISRWLKLLETTPTRLSPSQFLDIVISHRFRTIEDRDSVFAKYEQIFAATPEPKSYFHNLCPNYYQVGLGSLSRNSLMQNSLVPSAPVLTGDFEIIESLMLCINQGWPSILTGPTGCGKTTILRKLASLSGSRLVELFLNAETDTMDLIGGFEQTDIQRYISTFVEELSSHVRYLVIVQLSGHGLAIDPNLLRLQHILASNSWDLNAIYTSLSGLVHSINSPELVQFLEICTSLLSATRTAGKVGFEWTEGLFLQAVQNGHWVVLDNANLCNSSVLDRLNSLMEPNGTLTVNEQKMGDGSAKIVTPHANFRLFLTMDPRHGELSRAMRNRCVEICFLPKQDSEKCPTPALTYSDESSINRMRPCHELSMLLSDEVPSETLFGVAFDHLSSRDLSFLDSEAAKSLRLFHESTYPLYSLLHRYTSIFTSSSLPPLFNQLGIQISSGLEPINALTNEPVLAGHMSNGFKAQVLQLTKLQELYLDVFRFNQVLTSVIDSAAIKKPSEMTALERSISSARIATLRKESIQPAGNFLYNCSQAVGHFVQSYNTYSSDGSELISTARSILDICWDFLGILQSNQFSEGLFQAYLQSARQLLRRSEGIDNTIFQIFSQSLSTFNADWGVSSGQSMQLIWNAWRPITAKHLPHLELVLKLRQISTRFDHIALRSHKQFGELSQLRSSLVKAQDTVVRGAEDNDLIKNLDTVISDLERRFSSFNPIEGAFFATEFEALSQYYDLFTNAESASNLIEPLQLLAGRDSHPHDGSSSNHPVPGLLSRLSSFAGFSNLCGRPLALQGTLALSVIQKITSMDAVPLKGMDLLESELQMLRKGLSSNMQLLQTDQLELLQGKLRFIFKELLVLHRDLLDSVSLHAVCEALEEPSKASITNSFSLQLRGDVAKDSYLANFTKTIFKDCLKSLLWNTNSRREKAFHCGMASIRLAVSCLWFFVPNKPFDPCLSLTVEHERHNARLADRRTRIDALKFFETIFTGQNSSLRIRLLEDELRSLGESPPLPPLSRPSPSHLHELHGELLNLFNSILSQNLEQFVSLDSQCDLLRNNITQIRTRLANYSSYNDIVMPVIRFLEILDTGVFLVQQSRACSAPSSALSSVHAISEITPFLSSQQTNIFKATISYHHTDIYDETRMHIHRLAVLGVLQNTDESALSIESHRQNLYKILNELYSIWKDRLTEDQKQEATRSSLYRYKGSYEEETQYDDAEFHQLFPNYDEDGANAQGNHSPAFDVNAFATQISDVVDRLFLPQDKELAMKNLILGSTQLIGSILKKSPISSALVNPSEHYAAVALLLDSSETPLTDLYNFYSDPNLPEAKKFAQLTEKIQLRFSQLHESWPDHATPLDVLKCCAEIFEFKHRDPVAKFITKAEKLHEFVHQWQLVASREFSAAAHYDELTNILISWRRLELSTWARLFDIEVENCKNDASRWWFIAYEVIIAAPLRLIEEGGDLSNHCSELVSTLETFFLSTSHGQYKTRLQLVNQFRQLAILYSVDIPQLGQVVQVLGNVYDHFVLFVQPIESALFTGRRSLEKELQEVVQLASWKDTNINALRESARRSHHKLFKYVRKFRECLAQSSSAVLSQDSGENPHPVPTPEFSLAVSVLDEPLSVKYCRENLKSWHQRPIWLQDPRLTVSSMLRVYTKAIDSLEVAHDIETFTTDVVQSIEDFKSRTPKTLTEDNKGEVQHLKSQKRSFYADRLKGLRHMGIRFNVGTDILEKQSSTSIILSSTPHIQIPENVPISFSDSYFHRLLDLMPHVRLASRNYAEDLSNNEVFRSVGCIEGLLHWILRQREVLSSRVKQISSFSSSVDKLRNVSKLRLDDARLQTQSSPSCPVVRRALQRLGTMIGVSLSILQIHCKHSDSYPRNVIDEVKTLKDHASILLSSISALAELPIRITSNAHEETCAEAIAFLESTRLKLVNLMSLHPETTFALQAALPFTAIDTIPNGVSDEVSSISLDQFEELFSKTTNKILVSLQKISPPSENLVSDKPQSWLQRTDQLLVKNLAELHMTEISAEVQQVLAAARHLPTGSSVANLAAAILGSLTPIVQQYESICLDLVSRYARIDHGMCKMAYILAKCFTRIASEGFCSPQEASSEQGNSNQLESGTGLGEGEGAEDISKDIQDDEDLSELAQEKQKDDDNKEVDETKDDAVNMDQEDLEADASDYENDKEDDDENKQSGEENNDDLDEETGSVDGLDADAVDEKMWDGKNDQEQKDTENEKGEGVGENENDVAASDKDDKKEENKKDQKEDAEDKEEADEENEGEEEGSDVDDEGEAIGKEENETADPFVKQEEALELPEDMELDGQNEENHDSTSDDEMDNMSDASNWGGQETEKPEDGAEPEANEEDNQDQNDEQMQGDEDNEEAAEKPEDLDTQGEPEAEPQPEPTQEEENKDAKERGPEESNADKDNAAESEVVADGAGIDQDQNEDQGASGEAVQDSGSKDQSEANKQVNKTDTGEESAETSNEAGGRDEAENDKSSEALKTLGDILEEWHKRQRDIKNASEDQATPPDMNEDVDMENVDFEHLKDDNEAADAQALGQANEEEATGLDQQKAVESREPPQDEHVMPQPEESLENDDEQMTNDQMEVDQTTSAPTEKGGGSFVANDRRPEEMPTSAEAKDLKDNLEDVDTSLSTLHMTSELSPLTSPEEASRLWSHYESLTHDLSLSLTEQLRLILAPTMATKLRGDFRTGKRLNIKRIIPYIASNFKRDKIWMRRSIPSKRNYQIMLAVDDSRSMLESGSDQLAFETLALVSKSLSMLEAGDLCVVNFGNAEHVRVAHEFGKTFSSESGSRIFQHFSFQQNGTNVRRLISDSISLFQEARNQKSRGAGGADLWQLELIVSDGICVDHESIRRLVRHAQEERIMIVFIIVDSNKGNSVLDLKEARFEADPNGLGEKKLKMTRYLEEFPFAYYLVVRDVQELPAVLSLALKQWFAEVVDVS